MVATVAAVLCAAIALCVEPLVRSAPAVAGTSRGGRSVRLALQAVAGTFARPGHDLPVRHGDDLRNPYFALQSNLVNDIAGEIAAHGKVRQ